MFVNPIISYHYVFFPACIKRINSLTYILNTLQSNTNQAACWASWESSMIMWNIPNLIHIALQQLQVGSLSLQIIGSFRLKKYSRVVFNTCQVNSFHPSQSFLLFWNGNIQLIWLGQPSLMRLLFLQWLFGYSKNAGYLSTMEQMPRNFWPEHPLKCIANPLLPWVVLNHHISCPTSHMKDEEKNCVRYPPFNKMLIWMQSHQWATATRNDQKYLARK